MGRQRNEPIGSLRWRSGAPARQIATQGGLIGGADQAAARAQQAAMLAKRLGEVEAALLAEPRVGFPLAIAHRRQGYPRQAERFYLSLSRTRPHDAWWAAGECEQWLAERRGLAPRPVAPCVRTAAKPRLDGQLDDAVWKNLRPLELHSVRREDASWSAVAMLAYDDEFLYLAASCRQVESIRRSEIEKKREHDADLSWQDRIEFCLDVDRDRSTFYRLSIDQRGCTHDECWHDATWNPKWFVATARQDDTWTVEAAIPLVELARFSHGGARLGFGCHAGRAGRRPAKLDHTGGRRTGARRVWAAAVRVSG